MSTQLTINWLSVEHRRNKRHGNSKWLKVWNDFD